jgi:hypothetical protein
MKVMLKSAVLWDKEHRDAGEVIEVNDVDASWLMSRGKAVPYAEPEKPVKNRAEEVETSEAPKTTKRAWKKKAAESE